MKRYFLIFLVFCIIVSILLSLTYPLKFEEVQTIVPEEELNQINEEQSGDGSMIEPEKP